MAAREMKLDGTSSLHDRILKGKGEKTPMTINTLKKAEKEEEVKVSSEEVQNVQETPEIEEKNPMAVMKSIFQETQEEKEEKFKQVTVYLNEDNLELFQKHFKKKGQKSKFINEMLDMYFETMGLKSTLKRNQKK
jgi:hypothetical protein